MSEAYRQAWNRSVTDPDAFWSSAANAIHWYTLPERIYDEKDGWFAGGTLNTAANCLDRQIAAGRGELKALIYDSPVTGQLRHFTYSELLAESGRVAAMLKSLGVGKGDRVIIYMPMIPETVFAMLACARIGAIHSVVFGGFAALELAKRVDDAQPRLIMTASCGIEGSRLIAYKPMVDGALALAKHKIPSVLLFQRSMLAAELITDRDIDWMVYREQCSGDPIPDPEPMAASDPLYILYTSGTTGVPKGVVREHGGHAVALAWSMANIYGIGPGETFWAASDVGWVVGHSYIVYAPLLVGATTILFEGKPVGTPDAGSFWRTIVAHDAKSFFCAPTAIRAIRKEDPDSVCSSPKLAPASSR
jgi:propionyl-CoA synthetase